MTLTPFKWFLGSVSGSGAGRYFPTVNVWFDQPGDFLEIGWSDRWAVTRQPIPRY